MTRKVTFLPYKARSILNKHKHPDHWFWSRYTAYPYKGCQHGCEFCYSRESKYAPHEDIADFAYLIKIKENALELAAQSACQSAQRYYLFGRLPASRAQIRALSQNVRNLPGAGFSGAAAFTLPAGAARPGPAQGDQPQVARLGAVQHHPHISIAARRCDQPHGAPGSHRRSSVSRPCASWPKPAFAPASAFMPILPDLCDTPENLELVIRQTADNGGQFVLASSLTLADQQKAFFMDFLKDNFPELYPRYQQLYPVKSYSPANNHWPQIGIKVREICQQVGIPDRMPRPIRPGEKRALNKRAAEMLANKTYSMELEGEEDRRIWPYRKAFWAIEDFPQDIGLVYDRMGLKGLQSIQNVGPSIGKQIEQLIIEDKSAKRQESA